MRSHTESESLTLRPNGSGAAVGDAVVVVVAFKSARADMVTLDCARLRFEERHSTLLVRKEQARVCMLCDAFCSHTALLRAKGVHQPRDSSAVFSQNQNAIKRNRAGNKRTTRRSRRGAAGRQLLACIHLPPAVRCRRDGGGCAGVRQPGKRRGTREAAPPRRRTGAPRRGRQRAAKHATHRQVVLTTRRLAVTGGRS